MTPIPGEAPQRLALWSLLFGNFVIGTGVLLPAGLLNVLGADLHVPPATAGLLLFAGGLVVGVGAPVLAGLTSRFDRRVLLAVSAAIFAVGHGLAALAPEFWSLLVIRTVTMVAAALFTPQAAATIGLLVPPQRRSEAIAFIFIGWSLASVVGIPLGSILGTAFGWRATFLVMAVLAAVSCVGVMLSLKPGLRVQPLQFSSWVAVFKNPALLCILLVTLLSMSGQFTVVSYLAPILREAFAATPNNIALMFGIFGVAGVLGNYLATKAIRRFGVDRAILVALCFLIAGLGMFGLFFGNYVMGCIACFTWGLGTFSSNSLQQSRLVVIAPPLAAATVALNTSAVYLGQSVGAATGGFAIKDGISASVAWMALGFLAVAIALSMTATRLAARR
ncbi:MAG TPA: MFS transporter [Aestuariivirga sp.]|nr:MFS transporter [Hyphomicrobiales bacterium]HQX84614.1 MFS transporter [Aestuariivirga sp.]HQY73057.1 MFS transporter [Aestuariivirga sp.]